MLPYAARKVGSNSCKTPLKFLRKKFFEVTHARGFLFKEERHLNIQATSQARA